MGYCYRPTCEHQNGACMEDIQRSLGQIAAEIQRTWTRPYFGAVPYLQAMRQLDSVTDDYGYDSGVSIVLYFLSNATTWRGDDARRIKAELKSLVNGR